MKTNDDIEAYLLQMGRDYTMLQAGVWMIHDQYDDIEDIVVVNTPPVVTFRVKIMPVPAERREEFFATLLRLNASDMVAGAYGVEGDSVVITDTLQGENLDLNEFEASLDGISVAIAMHTQELRAFASAHTAQDSALPLAEERALEEFGARLDEETA